MAARDTVVLALFISYPDRPGIVATVSRFVFERGGTIIGATAHYASPTT